MENLRNLCGCGRIGDNHILGKAFACLLRLRFAAARRVGLHLPLSRDQTTGCDLRNTDVIQKHIRPVRPVRGQAQCNAERFGCTWVHQTKHMVLRGIERRQPNGWKRSRAGLVDPTGSPKQTKRVDWNVGPIRWRPCILGAPRHPYWCRGKEGQQGQADQAKQGKREDKHGNQHRELCRSTLVRSRKETIVANHQRREIPFKFDGLSFRIAIRQPPSHGCCGKRHVERMARVSVLGQAQM